MRPFCFEFPCSNPSKVVYLPCAVACFWMLTLSCFVPCAAQNRTLEGKWLVHLSHTDIGLARTILQFQVKDSSFTAHTRKNADRDILGGWTSFLGRAFTKGMKNGSLVRIENGILLEQGDTLHLAGILVTPMGRFNIEGFVSNDRLTAGIKSKTRGRLGELTGIREIPRLPMEDYAALFDISAGFTEQKIYNRRVLQTKEWNNFVNDMRQITPKLQDDLEMIVAFFYKARKLPFSHFALMKFQQTEEKGRQAHINQLLLEEKSAETAYLKISSFAGSAAEVDSIFEIIHQNSYSNLIVDLRNNSGGSIEAGMAFATSVVDTTLFGGVFLTQKWFNRNEGLPTIADYQQFPHFTEANFDLIIEGIHQFDGLCLKIIPKQTIYKGNLYLLTDNRTASACEPIVYELQKHRRAIVVGEKTAGMMLNGEIFELDSGFRMVIPTADYYTSDGFRIDRAGVNPDIKTRKADALQIVLELLNY